MNVWLVLEFAKTVFLVGWITWLLSLIREGLETGESQ